MLAALAHSWFFFHDQKLRRMIYREAICAKHSDSDDQLNHDTAVVIWATPCRFRQDAAQVWAKEIISEGPAYSDFSQRMIEHPVRGEAVVLRDSFTLWLDAANPKRSFPHSVSLRVVGCHRALSLDIFFRTYPLIVSYVTSMRFLLKISSLCRFFLFL